MRCRRALLAVMVAIGVLALPAAATARDVRSEKVDVFSLNHRAVGGAASLFRDNLQTQERLFRRDRDEDDDDDEDEDDDDVSKQRGVFTTLPDGTAMGLTISGFAKITRSEDGTKVKAVVRGLAPRTTYAAHLHNAPCSAANPGGGHYMNVPGGPAMPPNELWLSSTDDPFAGITSNAGGVAFGRGSADWIARPEAQSVVIHFIPPGGTTAGGPKIACADLL
jgi:hypothetical protein